MAFQFRRGTDAERQTITPKSGEPLYVTDTGKLYVGDGTSQGGIAVSLSLSEDNSPQLSSNLNLNGNNVVGTGNIEIDGYINATGNINLGDGAEDNVIVGGVIASSLIPNRDREYDIGSPTFAWRNGFFEGLSINGEISANSLSVNNIYTEDSNLFFNSLTNTIYGNLLGDVTGDVTGDLTGDVTGDVNGNLIGDIQGSVFSDDSALIVDSVNNVIFAGDVSTDLVTTGKIITADILVQKEDQIVPVALSRTSDSDLSSFTGQLGRIDFKRDDINGVQTKSNITASNTGIYIGVDLGTAPDGDPSKHLTWDSRKLGVGTFTPADTLDVRGNSLLNGNVTASGFVQFGSFTTTERDSLPAQNGMVVYNTTASRFQGYQNNYWINLDDGTSA